MLPAGITIDAGGGTDEVVGNGDGFRIFNITAGPVTLKDLKLTGGDVSGNGGVSASDVSILAANFYANLQVLLVYADLDGDGEVTTADLDLAFAQYGLAGLMLSVA